MLDKAKSMWTKDTKGYRLGKVRNKYLILEVVGFSTYREEAAKVLWGTS